MAAREPTEQERDVPSSWISSFSTTSGDLRASAKLGHSPDPPALLGPEAGDEFRLVVLEDVPLVVELRDRGPGVTIRQ